MSGTRLMTLPDICAGFEFADGDWVESKDQDPNGEVRLIQLADVGDGAYLNKSNRRLSAAKAKELGCTMLQRGDVLISRMADPMGRACIFPGDTSPACTVVDVCIVRPDPEIADARWLAYTINSPAFRSEILSLASGTTRARISRGNLATLELEVPPIDVQRRIVAKLDALLAQTRAAREQLEAVPALVEQYRQSVLAAAFRGDLTADWRKKNPDVEPASKLLERIRIERRQKWEAAELAKFKAKGKAPKDDKWKSKYVEPEPVDTSDLPELPPTWCWANLEQVTSEADGIVDGPFGSNLKSADYVQKGPVVVRLGNLGVGVFKTAELARVPLEKFEQLRRHEVLRGDLIVSALAEPVGRCCRVPDTLGPAIVKADCVRVRPVPVLARDFVMWSLNSPESLTRAANAGHGLGRVRMNLTDIRGRAVPIAPVNEQVELLSALQRAMAAGANLAAVIESADVDQVERALLAKAFRGELVT